MDRITEKEKWLYNILLNYHTFRETAISYTNYDAIAVLNDIDTAILKTKLSPTQLRRIELLKSGMNYTDIARMESITRQGSRKCLYISIRKICKHIKSEVR